MIWKNDHYSCIRYEKNNCFDFYIVGIGVVIATKWIHYLFYWQPYRHWRVSFLPKSFTEGYSSNSCSMIVTFEQTENVFDIFWYEVFLVKNLVNTGQSYCSAAIKGRDGAVVRALAVHQCCQGFKSRRRRQMWVEFVVGSLLCSERYSGFPLS